MNKIFRFALVAATAACTLGFASCSDDDDDDNNNNSETSVSDVLGTWACDESSEKVSYTLNGKSVSEESLSTFAENFSFQPDSMTFKNDGVIDLMYTSDKDEEGETITGTYEINGNDFAVSYKVDGESCSFKKGYVVPAEDETDFSMSIKDFKIDVNGDKLTLTCASEYTIDLSSLSDELEESGLGSLSALTGKQTIVATSVITYNRQK